jgi:hypothetical protein
MAPSTPRGWFNLGDRPRPLHIVEKYYGRDVALQTAKEMEYETNRWMEQQAPSGETALPTDRELRRLSKLGT